MLQSDTSLLGAVGSARAQVRSEQPPFAQLYGLESMRRGRLAQAMLVALTLHATVATRGLWGLWDVGDFARVAQQSIRDRLRQSIDVQVEPEPVPEPEPIPEPVPEPEPIPEPKRAEPPPPSPPQPEPPAPAAAQAGRVLTAEPDPEEPLDLTGNAFVQGNADFYAGGVTASKGTSTRAVRNPLARPDGATGGTGKAAISGVDLSRPARPVQKSWACPFPAESELEQINYQQVSVAVTVSAAGKALDVKVIGNTDFGFGSAAQRCGLTKAFVPALDRTGAPITTTIPVVVTFVRR